MNKVLLGLLLGAVLGAIDGATAWLTPAVRSMMVGIIVGSTAKGLIAGVAAGVFARKVNSVPLGCLGSQWDPCWLSLWLTCSMATTSRSSCPAASWG